MSEANKKQVGGGHYQKQGIQHWDYVAANGLDYFQGQVTKYVSRWKDKNGIQDLEKARHFLDKYIELEKAKAAQVAEVKADEKPADWCTSISGNCNCSRCAPTTTDPRPDWCMCSGEFVCEGCRRVATIMAQPTTPNSPATCPCSDPAACPRCRK